MKALLPLLIALISLQGSTTLAQQYNGYSVYLEPDHATNYDPDHDHKANDPSTHQHLKLKRVIKQGRFAATETIKEIRNSLWDSFLSIPHFLVGGSSCNESLLPVVEYKKLVQQEPQAFKILDVHRNRYLPKAENGPTFVNSNWEFEGISDRRFGYCWGFTTLVRDFHTLAFYEPNPTQFTEAFFDQRKNFLAFYYNKIDELLEGSATVFPGFRNFRELSSVPELELYLKIKTMHLWQERAVQMNTLGIFFASSKIMKLSDVKTLISTLQEKLARGEMPKILFTAAFSKKLFGGSTDIHSVLVNDVVQMPDGKLRIMLWDANFYAESLIGSPKFIEVMPNGDMHYAPWWEANNGLAPAEASTLLGTVQIAPEDGKEVAQMVASLKYFCEKFPQYCDGNH